MHPRAGREARERAGLKTQTSGTAPGPRGEALGNPSGRSPGAGGAGCAGRLGPQKLLVICLSNLLPVALLFTPKGCFFDSWLSSGLP